MSFRDLLKIFIKALVCATLLGGAASWAKDRELCGPLLADPSVEISEDELASDKLHLWDNWVVFDPYKGVYHRYSLAAPKHLEPSERHAQAYFHHFTSPDKKHWKDLGPVEIAKKGDDFCCVTHWSGDTVLLGKGQFLKFYTEVLNDGKMTQQIVLAESTDGHHFVQLRQPILTPTTRLGYSLSRSDNKLMAWRDPSIYIAPNGQIHMFFAAKAEASQGQVVPVVGHAVAKNNNHRQWELKPPIYLPGNGFTQVELPNVVERNGEFLLMVGTTDRVSNETPDDQVKLETRIYRSTSLDGGWQPYDGNDGIFLQSDSSVWALKLVKQHSNQGDEVDVVGFHPKDIFLTPIFKIKLP